MVKKELASFRGNGHDRRIPMNLIAVSPQCVLSSIIAAKAETSVQLQKSQGRRVQGLAKPVFSRSVRFPSNKLPAVLAMESNACIPKQRK